MLQPGWPPGELPLFAAPLSATCARTASVAAFCAVATRLADSAEREPVRALARRRAAWSSSRSISFVASPFWMCFESWRSAAAVETGFVALATLRIAASCFVYTVIRAEAVAFSASVPCVAAMRCSAKKRSHSRM